MQIDWQLAQIQYEVFDVPFDQIAQEYDTTPRMVKYAAEKHGWKKNDLALVLQQKLEVGEIDSELIDQISERLGILFTVKSSALMPSYVMLEAALLSKCIAHVKSLDADNPASATNIKMVADVLKTLRDKASGGLGQQKDDKGAITVKILNQVNRDKSSQTAMEINVAAA